MLRYATSTLTVFAFAGALTVFAQEQKPAPAPEPSPAPAPASEKLTGCVQEAKTTSNETVYVLNKVEGTTSPMYVLSGPPATELATHLNHKVEVMGQVRQPTAPPSEDKKVLRPPTVQVETVTMVAETCQ